MVAIVMFINRIIIEELMAMSPLLHIEKHYAAFLSRYLETVPFATDKPFEEAPPPTGVPSWGDDPKHSRTALIAAIVAKVFKPWQGKGISETDVARAVGSEANCFLIRVVDGKVYSRSPNEGRYVMHNWLVARRTEAVKMFVRLTESRKVPNVEVAVCPDDTVVTQEDHERVRFVPRCEGNSDSHCMLNSMSAPAFTHVWCSNSDNIPFPIWNALREGEMKKWDDTARNNLKHGREVPWSKRKPVAVFRGAARVCYLPMKKDDNGEPLRMPLQWNKDEYKLKGESEVLPNKETWEWCGRLQALALSPNPEP